MGRIRNVPPNRSLSDFHNGDVVVIEDSKGELTAYNNIEILNAGSGKEEILLEHKDNVYFIFSMYQKGESWVKKAWSLGQARVEVKL